MASFLSGTRTPMIQTTTLTVNGSVVIIESGYEIDYIEPKNINGKNMILVHIVKRDSTKAILVDSLGRNAVN